MAPKGSRVIGEIGKEAISSELQDKAPQKKRGGEKGKRKEGARAKRKNPGGQIRGGGGGRERKTETARQRPVGEKEEEKASKAHR